jgi:CheY-like chemotaxis protein
VVRPPVIVAAGTGPASRCTCRAWRSARLRASHITARPCYRAAARRCCWWSTRTVCVPWAAASWKTSWRLHGPRGPARAEAVRVAGEHRGRIDLLVTDVGMPRMSGREVAGRLAAMHPGGEGVVPVGVHRLRGGAARHPGGRGGLPPIALQPGAPSSLLKNQENRQKPLGFLAPRGLFQQAASPEGAGVARLALNQAYSDGY